MINAAAVATSTRDPEMVLAAHTTPAEAASRPKGWRELDYLPVGLFASVMGLTGLSVAWRLARAHFGAPAIVAKAAALLAVAAFVAVAAGYVVKLAAAPKAVAAEFRHPIAGNLFGTVFVSLLLLPFALPRAALEVSRAVWLVGAIGMVVFAWVIVSRWISSRQQVVHATPAWIIPVVGLLDVPLAVPMLGLGQMHMAMLWGLAIGLFFAVPLFTLIFSRLAFEAPMPDALQPSLLILVAPFAVGYSAYVATTGQTDLFARALYVLMLFMLAVLLPRMRYLRTCCPFRVSWWAVSFPLAASSITALRVAIVENSPVTDAIALALLGLATVAIGGLLARTLWGVARGELRTLSG